MEYRRRNNSDTWHWCSNCSNWPTKDYETKYTKPADGEQCDQCRGKEASGSCTK